MEPLIIPKMDFINLKYNVHGEKVEEPQSVAECDWGLTQILVNLI